MTAWLRHPLLWRFVGIATALGALWIAPAFADVEADRAGAQLDEIVVTAQKRAQNIQDVPMSVTALSSDALAKAGVVSSGDIQYLAPGLTISNVGSGFTSYTYIRGGGTNQIDPGSDPSVAYFLDEVYLGGTAGLQFDLVDVDHIEVLKGPQGTLFGRNAASGAISIISKQPSSKFGGTLDVDLGNYDYTHLKGSVTGPIAADERWLYRAAFDFRRRDGYGENLVDGKHVDDVDTYGGRVELEYFADDFKFLLSADAMRARDGMTPQFIATANKTSFLNPRAIATLPGGEAFYAHYYNVPGYENQNLGDLTGRMEWKSAIGTLIAVTGLRTNTFDRLADYDATAADGLAIASHEVDQTFSEELRVVGDNANWHWIGGLYYYHARTIADWRDHTGPAFPLAGVPFAALTGRPIPGAYPSMNAATDDSVLSSNSEAVFGQLTYDFTQQASLSVGGRYSKDRKQDQRSVLSLVPAAIGLQPFTIDPHAAWDSFDPSVTFNYEITPDVLTYVSYRQGYKSGGFQTFFPTTEAIANTSFAPEKVKSYEVGLKSEWFGHRFLANIAVFRSDITDQQVSRAVSLTQTLIDNAAATRDTGVDLILTAKPVPALTLGASMTIQHARFETFVDGGINYGGNAQLRSPDFSGNYLVEYDVGLPAGSRLGLRADYFYQSKEFFNGVNSMTPGLYQPGYGLANARITYTPNHRNWSVALWGKNLANTHYYRSVVVIAPSGLAIPGDPLTFGGSFNVIFR